MLSHSQPKLESVTLVSLSALTLENLAGDFYVPGTDLAKNDKGRWPEILVSQLQPNVS